MTRTTLLSLLVLALPFTAAAEEKADAKRTIAVVGQGEVKAAPDLVRLSFAVETTAVRAGDAVAENAKRSAAVAAAVKAQLDAKDTVTSTRYALDPRYEQAKPGEPREPRITGYVAHNEVRVETHKVDAAGALVDAATGAGANRVSGLEFALAQRAEAVGTAIEKAGADARAQAEHVAVGLGVHLRGVLQATVSSGPTPIPRPRYDVMAMAAPEARVQTSIEPGELTVTATLQVTYELE
jgi:hypothetical protein